MDNEKYIREVGIMQISSRKLRRSVDMKPIEVFEPLFEREPTNAEGSKLSKIKLLRYIGRRIIYMAQENQKKIVKQYRKRREKKHEYT